MIEIFVIMGLAYGLGSIPTGYLMGRGLKGIDIRTVGSGNVGATNVFRSVGKMAGVATLLVDIAKGFLAVELALIFLGGNLWPLFAGVAVVGGHSWSFWVHFRGGKGVATSAGVFLALLPVPMGIALLVFALLFGLSRRVSVGSIGAAMVLPVAAQGLESPASRVLLALILSGVVIFRHIPNIRRLLRGEEPPLFTLSKKGPLP
ncbi:MAG: glycerol-3-phosphate 1-O-acyltransferase PlsY [Elusimicrobia bacterium]|jgi:glycerol-3-phosphate acyltransferase PlsY|nr:glycerol-3-phosphate 1-O-acyltransferase PlsY [Elusimicrobiota bacterium]